MPNHIQDAILHSVSENETDIVAFTKDLVAIATENPPGNNYKPCVDLMANKLSEIGLDYEIIEVPESGSLKRYCIDSSYGTGDNILYFHGHYDVVPASKPDQFNPLIKSGKLYGRGSSDMKSGLAAMIYAVKAIKDANFGFHRGLFCCFFPRVFCCFFLIGSGFDQTVFTHTNLCCFMV